MILPNVTLARLSLSSSLLLETIRCEAGSPQNLAYHQQRLDQSLKTLGYNLSYPLAELISPPDTKVYRCRFVYDDQNYTIEYHPYTSKPIQTIKLVYSNLSYSLKYADRTELNRLADLKEGCDDILIIQNDLLRDTSIANIALQIQGQWFTPEFPLLAGTTRARLLDEKQIMTAPLRLNDLKKASKIALMNAMIGFVELENGIIR